MNIFNKQHSIITITTIKAHIEIYYDLIKAYDTVNHMWLIEVLKSYKISNKIVRIIEYIIKNWNIDIFYGKRKITNIKLNN